MQSVIPPGHPDRTRIAGQSQGWKGLAINFGMTEDTGFPTMTTAWQPTPDELAALNAGASVVVQILGKPPINPMSVYVGSVPE